LQGTDFKPVDPVAGQLSALLPGPQKAPTRLGGELGYLDVVINNHGLKKAVKLTVFSNVYDTIVDALRKR
jgi:hypothetical protein